MSLKNTLLSGVVCLGLALSAQASSTFDFESVGGGYYSSLSQTNNGLTLNVSVANGYVLASGSSVGLLGSMSVIGTLTNPAQVDMFTPLIFAFSSAVSSATFLFGDAGGDDDSPVYIHAYDSSDTLLSTLTGAYPGGAASGSSLTWSGSGASYFVLESTPGSNDHSIFWEVKDVQSASVPEATNTLGLLALALAGLAAIRRRA